MKACSKCPAFHQDLQKSHSRWLPVCKQAEEIKAICGRFITGFELVLEEGTSYLFSGKSCTGKTHLACAVGNNLLMKGTSVIYTSQLAYVSRVKDSWKSGSTTSEDEMVAKYTEPELLILDEIGKGQLGAKEKGFIHLLLDTRYEQCKPTIGLTNLTEDALCRVLEPETVRRMKAGGGGRC